jgi:biopolymer transport protein ExbD
MDRANVVIAADKSMSLQQIVDVMNAVLKAGINDFGLATKP